MKAYTTLLSILVVVMIALIVTRKTVDTYISRVKGQMYQEMPNDRISNLFEAKIINKTNDSIPIYLKVEGEDGKIEVIGIPQIVLKSESINKFTFFLSLPKSALKRRSNSIKIGVYHGDERIQTIKTKFLGPFL